MERRFITTGDGSVTIQLPEWNEQYHSIHGAVQEAVHVFINEGFKYYLDHHQSKEVSILEIGFGTGLNAFITHQVNAGKPIEINYVGVEAYPVSLEEIEQLNYPDQLSYSNHIFLKMHQSPWELPQAISEEFLLTKRKQFFAEIEDEASFDLIYFDAFGARVQPELWTELIFAKMYKALKSKGILVTYSAKGSVRRAMQTVGFNVERLPGPPGKREMLRDIKE